MTYPHQAEIARWLENWVRWSPGTFGKSQWNDTVSSRVYDGTSVPTITGEAADTQEALQRTPRGDRDLLLQFHLGRAPLHRLAKRRGIAVRTLERRLHEVHARFYQARCDLKASAQLAGAENARTSGTSLHRRRTTAGADVARIRRQRDKPAPADGGSR